MRKLTSFLIFLATFSTFFPCRVRASDIFRIDGEARQETAFRVSSNKGFGKIKEFIKTDLTFKPIEELKFKLGGRAFYDAVYDLTDQYPKSVRDDMRKEIDLRDAYINISLPSSNIRIGHQQIVWGEALGQFFSDVINPKDLREFLLPNFDDVRLPIWALDVQQHFSKKFALEVVLSPDQSTHKLALPGSDFAFYFPQPENIDVALGPDKNPMFTRGKWNAGARFSALLQGFDLSLYYYTGPDLVPALEKSISISQTTGNPLLTLDPVHHRIQHLGTTWSKSIGPTILRGELDFTPERFFNAKDITVNNGLVTSKQLRHLVGFDYTIAGKVDMNIEFQQEVIIGSTHQISDDPLKSWVFVRLSTGFIEEKVVPEVLVFVGLDHGDNQVSLHLTYKPIPLVAFRLGADLFKGPPDTLYGQFNKSDRIYLNNNIYF